MQCGIDPTWCTVATKPSKSRVRSLSCARIIIQPCTLIRRALMETRHWDADTNARCGCDCYCFGEDVYVISTETW
jgi:hypothetical protein